MIEVRAMEEVYCPRCRKSIGFPFMKCPRCKWCAMGNQVKKRKDLAETYILEEPDNEDQNRMVLDIVLSEIEYREKVEGKRRIDQYKRHSWFTFKKYLISIPILIIAPYVILILTAGQGGGGQPRRHHRRHSSQCARRPG